MALYTGQMLHQILLKEKKFSEADYEEALRLSFLACDDAMRGGMCSCRFGLSDHMLLATLRLPSLRRGNTTHGS